MLFTPQLTIEATLVVANGGSVASVVNDILFRFILARTVQLTGSAKLKNKHEGARKMLMKNQSH